MLFIVLVIYIGGYLVAVPRVVRAFARDLSAVLPLEEADKFMAVLFGLLLSAFWPLLLIGVIVKNLMFPVLFKEDKDE